MAYNHLKEENKKKSVLLLNMALLCHWAQLAAIYQLMFTVINVHAATPAGVKTNKGPEGDAEMWSDNNNTLKRARRIRQRAELKHVVNNALSSTVHLCDALMEKTALVQLWVMPLGWKENVHPSFPMLKEHENNLNFSVSNHNHNYATQLNFRGVRSQKAAR